MRVCYRYSRRSMVSVFRLAASFPRLASRFPQWRGICSLPQRRVHIPECAAEQRGYRRDAYATSE